LRTERQPPLIADRLTRRLAALTAAVKARNARPAVQAAVDVAQSALDLQLRYRPAGQVDLDRIHGHTQQLRVYAAARDASGVSGEVATIEWTRQRLALAAKAADRLDAALTGLRGANDDRNAAATADHAARIGGQARTFTALNP
jgi:head-tail adaptor